MAQGYEVVAAVGALNGLNVQTVLTVEDRNLKTAEPPAVQALIFTELKRPASSEEIRGDGLEHAPNNAMSL